METVVLKSAEYSFIENKKIKNECAELLNSQTYEISQLCYHGFNLYLSSGDIGQMIHIIVSEIMKSNLIFIISHSSLIRTFDKLNYIILCMLIANIIILL